MAASLAALRLHTLILLTLCTWLGLQPAAVAEERPLAAKDAIKIAVYEHPDLTIETKISDNGTVNFPLIGEVALAGLTTGTAATLIASRLDQGGYVRKPQVTIDVVSYGALVSVLGLVEKPGQYAIEGETTVIDLLARAGGTREAADHAVLILTKGSNGRFARRMVDMEAILGGQLAPNATRVADGDILFVPNAPLFYIYGEVQKPGAYRLNRDMTVMQALSVGAGLTPRGTERGMKIRRRIGPGTFRSVDAEPETLLAPDDVVYVPESLF